jgi:hypothetical protein
MLISSWVMHKGGSYVRPTCTASAFWPSTSRERQYEREATTCATEASS